MGSRKVKVRLQVGTDTQGTGGYKKDNLPLTTKICTVQ